MLCSGISSDMDKVAGNTFQQAEGRRFGSEGDFKPLIHERSPEGLVYRQKEHPSALCLLSFAFCLFC
jgi:hypothetical protein